MLVIDDSSPDGTAGIVENLIPKYKDQLHLLKRPGKQGGASAFLQSFEWGLKHGYDAMLAMDADFSHDPKYIPEMVTASSGCDVVIGSRLVKGGGIENRSIIRNIISHSASLYCRFVLNHPTTTIKDWTGGYNLWSKTAIAKIGLASIFTRAYSFQIEMKYKALRNRCKITEIPIIFPDRKHGASKMSALYFVKALIDVWRIKFSCIQSSTVKQILKFAVTGGLGTLTNLVLFFLCADIVKFPEIPVSIGCFVVAGTQNYVLHHKWSFAENTRGTAPSIQKWLAFLFSALIGLGMNIAILNLMLRHVVLPYKVIAQACGILAGMVINFLVSKFFVFRRKNDDEQTTQN